MNFNQLLESEKPREKAEINGLEALNDYELIAIVLNTGSKDVNVLELSLDLMQQFNGLKGLLKANLHDLCQVKGIKKAKAIKLLAICEIAKRLFSVSPTKDLVASSETVYKIFGPKLRFEQQENFIIVFLDTKNRIITYKTISKGGLDFSLLHPRDVFREAVKNNASKIVFVHNHPSGDPTPSDADIFTTKELMDLGERMGIPIIDHIIIGDGHFYSFKSDCII
jgi:DNA repair protein RadC